MSTINALTNSRSLAARRLATALAVGLTALCAMSTLPADANAGLTLVPDSFKADNFAADGTTPDTQAAAHPAYSSTEFEIVDLPDGVTPSGYLRDVEVKLPLGLAGYPEATPKCSRATYDALVAGSARCPAASQVGVLTYRQTGTEAFAVPLYNVEPMKGDLATFGMIVATVPLQIVMRIDPVTHGLVADVRKTSQGLPISYSKVTLWGVPADSSHDVMQRGCGDPVIAIYCPVSVPRKPFLSNPADCGASKQAFLRLNSWEEPDVFQSASYTPPEIEGCDLLRFEPSIEVAPTTTAPDSPSGLEVDLVMPQNDDPDGLGTPPLRTAKVTLPEGMTINPSSADGLAACSDAQLGLGTDNPLACPDGSKIGTVTAVSPSLANPVQGAVFLRAQNSADPASGEMFRLAMVLQESERGLLVKLDGQVRVNPTTGQVETTFEDNPQLPVSSLKLRLKSGPRAPLSTPSTCGMKTTTAEISSWAGHQVRLTDSFEVPCPAGDRFEPTFEAGSASPFVGAFTPFSARIGRPDGHQFLSGVRVDMPSGVLAKLRGVPLCGDFQAANGGCPAGSRVGTATVGAGSGSNPYYVTGDVYLTRGYKGAPYGMAAHVHAKAGPFDLGWVRVRQALHIDPDTAAVSVVSDPLPQVVSGVPVRLRDLEVNVDKQDFTVNPTSCEEKQVVATLTSIDGVARKTSSRYQVGGCRGLGFKPKLAMRLVGKKQMRSGGHPALRAVLTQSSGQANIRAAKVTLPRDVVLDSENSYDPKLVCPYDPSLKGDCPASSIIGKASLRTPLLNRPLSGPVHLVQGIRFENGNRIRALPTLLVKLDGEVRINLRSRTAVDRRNRLVSIVPKVPDARASKFSLQINGGRKGILVVTENRAGRINLCNSKQTAKVETDGQNGKANDFGLTVKTPCPKPRPNRLNLKRKR